MNPTVSFPFDADRHRRLRDLVDQAAERPAAEWEAFLEGECPEDAELRTEALRLLVHVQAATAEHFRFIRILRAPPGNRSIFYDPTNSYLAS
jgi:hypothetical protein